MKKQRYLLTCLLCHILGLAFNQSNPDLIIRNAMIVNVERGQVMPGPKDVLIRGERIVKIVNAGELGSYNGEVLDAEGKYIIPGLWDMHTHPDDPEVWWMGVEAEQRDLFMPLFVMFGVTGTRDMAGSLDVVKDWRARIKTGDLVGPEVIAAGPLLDGPNAMWDGSVSISGAEQVKHVVDSLITEGIDFLKVYSLLPREIFFSLCEYANEIGMHVVGHVPLDVTTTEATAAGMICQEHFLNILDECSSEAERIRAGDVDYGGVENRLEQYYIRNELILKTFDKKQMQDLVATYAEHNIWHTPTVSMWFKNAHFEQERERDSLYIKYMPRHIKKYWEPETNVHLRNRAPRLLAIKQKQVERYLELIKAMNDAGVPLLAGTDVGANPLCFPGVGIHNELSLFVKAGLTPAEALKTATINPVRFLGLEKDFGTVQFGKIADLVILRENPLEDIENIRDIEAVVRRGTLYDAADRKKILQEIEAQTKRD